MSIGANHATFLYIHYMYDYYVHTRAVHGFPTNPSYYFLKHIPAGALSVAAGERENI